MTPFVLLQTAAWAQERPVVDGSVPDLNAQLFRPSLDATRTLWTDTSATPASFGGGGRFLVHYADQPFVYRTETGDIVDVVGGIGQADVIGWLGGRRWRLGVDVPVVLRSTSDVDPDAAGLGDVAVAGKLVLVEEPAAFDLSVTGRVELPTSLVEAALGGRNTGWELAGVVNRSFGDLLLAVNVGVRGAAPATLENVALDDWLVLRAGGGYAVTDAAGLSLEATASPALPAPVTNPAAVPAEWMAGGWFPLGAALTGRAGFGTGLTPGIGAPDWRLVVGVSLRPPGPPEDFDGDGILDIADPCMTVPEDPDGVHDADGCPEDPPLVDVRVVDPDGVDIPGATVDLHAAGQDAEGVVLGGTQQIPPGSYRIDASAPGYEPGQASFEVAAADEGTRTLRVQLEPVKLATLRVTVVGPDDAPVSGGRIGARGEELGAPPGWEGTLTPGEATVRVQAPGYKPVQQAVVLTAGDETELVVKLEPARAELTGDRIDLRESVYFDTGKATIQARSDALLDEVGAILKDHPELLLLRIEGHTDSRGSASANLALSSARAEAVRAALVARGIAAERLAAQGYGETKPVDPREVAEAWDLNRRVDFVVEKRTE